MRSKRNTQRNKRVRRIKRSKVSRKSKRGRNDRTQKRININKKVNKLKRSKRIKRSKRSKGNKTSKRNRYKLKRSTRRVRKSDVFLKEQSGGGKLSAIFHELLKGIRSGPLLPPLGLDDLSPNDIDYLIELGQMVERGEDVKAQLTFIESKYGFKSKLERLKEFSDEELKSLEDGTVDVPGLKGIWPVIGKALVMEEVTSRGEDNQLRPKEGTLIYLTERPYETPKQPDLVWGKLRPDDESHGYITKRKLDIREMDPGYKKYY